MSKKPDPKKSVTSKPPAAPAKKGTAAVAKKGGNLKNSSNSSTTSKKSETKVVEKIEEKPKTPPKPVMSEEELKVHRSATVIQTNWRVHKAKQILATLKEEKSELDNKLQKLEQEAFIQMIKWEQEREHKKRMKQLKERQTMQRRAQRRKRFIEAAYDGNMQDLNFLITEFENELNAIGADGDEAEKLDEAKKKQALHGLIDCKDSNNNSALSEAAAGGSAEVVKFLLSRNADPNSKGAFGRTPLWRSAFQSHLSCVQVLLENGADPRKYTDDGQRPSDCATQPAVTDLLKNWNIQLTERMLQQIDKTRHAQKQEQINSLSNNKKTAKAEFDLVNSQYETVKIELYKCNCELQRLHDEYLLNEQMYAPLIDEKEAQRIELQKKYEELREKSVKARISFKDLLCTIKKEKKKLKKSKNPLEVDPNNDDDDDDDDNEEKKDGEKSQDSESDEGEFDDSNFMTINIKELDDILLRDLGGAVKNSLDKWPLIIDQNDQASTFLRYRDTNYINCLDVAAMKPETFRKALLGAIRYGKPLVLDLMQYDQELVESLKIIVEQIDSNLFVDLTNKSIMMNEQFLRLVKRDVDGKEYEIQNFSEIRLKNFKVLFLTSNPYPCDNLIKITMPVKIVTSVKRSDFDELDFY